jgi:hypothetical protein
MIAGHVSGGEKAAAEIMNIGPGLQQPLNLAVSRMAQILMGDFVKPRLKSNTGRLSASLNFAAENGEGNSGAQVTASAPEARFIEYGFEGVENLRGFLRLQKQAWGRPMASPREVWVRPHARQVSAPARSYLRAGLAEFEASGAFAEGIADVIDGVIS